MSEPICIDMGFWDKREKTELLLESDGSIGIRQHAASGSKATVQEVWLERSQLVTMLEEIARAKP